MPLAPPGRPTAFPSSGAGVFQAAVAALLACAFITACTTVGPEFVAPDPPDATGWSTPLPEGVGTGASEAVAWWRMFDDPVLDDLVDTAQRRNNNLQIAGLRVLEARAQLGVAVGAQYPQSQLALGDAAFIAPPENSGTTKTFWQYNLGVTASWEIDFWGRFRRGIESADAAFMASVAAYDQAQVLLTAQVVDTYTLVRATQEQLRIARENLEIQQRSYEIADVLYRQGADSELDVQQARTLLLSTRATIPDLEVSLRQASNALSVLLGEPPGGMAQRLAGAGGLPAMPDDLSIGFPADMLRRRPDVRQAEYLAMAQNALVGLATADLYPSFSLTGSIGLSAGRPGDSSFGNLFDADALALSIGPSFVWPFFNYGRIRNNIRIEDARLQQALIAYHETAIQAAREAEDALAAYGGALEQRSILEQTVASARRSNALSTLRYREGFSDYQRVLDSQQSLFTQQQRLVTSRTDAVRSMIALFQALGGGWQGRDGLPYIDPETLQIMRERIDWGELLDAGYPARDGDRARREPDW